MVLALITVWLAIAASFETNWPIGFFVGAGGAACYAAGRGWAAWHRSRSGQAGRTGMARSGTAGAPATAANVRL